MTDAAYGEFLADDAHFMIGVNAAGDGPVLAGDPTFSHYACACGHPYYPCPYTPLDADQLEAIDTLVHRQESGPWHVEPPVHSPGTRPEDSYDVLDQDMVPIIVNITRAQAQFIALSRDLVPRLVHQLQRVTADLERTTKAMAVLGQAMAEHEAQLYPEGQGDTDPIEVIR